METLATVLRANKNDDELGGHIATFSSAAMLYDIGFNYFFRGQESENDDLIYFQYLHQEFMQEVFRRAFK